MTRYDENGTEIGFTLFIDEKDISDLPLDRETVEQWTIEEEIEYRKIKEEERRIAKEFDKYLEGIRQYGIVEGIKRYGKEER